MNNTKSDRILVNRCSVYIRRLVAVYKTRNIKQFKCFRYSGSLAYAISVLYFTEIAFIVPRVYTHIRNTHVNMHRKTNTYILCLEECEIVRIVEVFRDLLLKIINGRNFNFNFNMAAARKNSDRVYIIRRNKYRRINLQNY